MERLELWCGGTCRGEVVLVPQGPRVQIRARMDDPGDGLYRAWLTGRQGELPLGVLEPGEGGLALCRRPYAREVAAIGPPVRGEARRSFRFRDEAGWQETACPAELFREPFLHERLRGAGRAWWRRERGTLYLALPWPAEGPFPLEALFCFARVEEGQGGRRAVFAFREEAPVVP